MLSDVHGGATVFSSQGESLQQAKNHEHDRRGNSDAIITGQESNRCCGATHDQKRREKRELPPRPIANPSKHQRAEWPNGEADREGR